MNIRFYFRFFVPFLLLQLCSIVHCTSTGNGENGKIKNTATGRGGGAQNIKPNNNSRSFHKMQEIPSPAADLAGKRKHRRETSPNVAHNQAIGTKRAKVNKEHGLIRSSSSCSVSIKKFCCKRVCQKRRPHISGAHHHSSVMRMKRQANYCAGCGVNLDIDGECDCTDEEWQHDSEGEEEAVTQAPPSESDTDEEDHVVPDLNYASDGDAVVPDSSDDD